MHIIVLIFEVLYYSLFMKFARKEGKFYKYVIISLLLTTFLLIIGSSTLYGTLLIPLILLLGIKFIIKENVTLYDFLLTVIITLVKVFCEILIVLLFFNILNYSILITTIIFTILKFLFIFIVKDKINNIYNKLNIRWLNNDFYIRYIFSVIIYIYTIITLILLFFY